MRHPSPFGRYVLLEKIATGGMAEVFLASPVGAPTERLVVKRILPQFGGNMRFINMFLDEAKLASQMEHANLVRVLDLGKTDGSYYLAMEWVAGQTLAQLLTRTQERKIRFPPAIAVHVAAELLRGLDYAHRMVDSEGRRLGIVHRDVSPQNVLVGYDGTVKLTDFGVAKSEVRLDLTMEGVIKGKLAYMAPEQVTLGGPEIDHRMDQFSMGVVLWEMFTQKRLFSGKNEIEVIDHVRHDVIQPPSVIASDIPCRLDAIVMKALARDRDQRFPSCAEMAEALDQSSLELGVQNASERVAALVRYSFEHEYEAFIARESVTRPIQAAIVPPRPTPPLEGESSLVTRKVAAVLLPRSRKAPPAPAPAAPWEATDDAAVRPRGLAGT